MDPKSTTKMRIPGCVDYLNLCVSKEKISKVSSTAKKKKKELGSMYIYSYGLKPG